MLGQWLEDIVKETMEFWGIPGLSIAIVRDTQVILSQGFGFRNLEERLPVTPQTIFATGSSTKAFTATAPSFGRVSRKICESIIRFFINHYEGWLHGSSLQRYRIHT